MWDVHRVLAAFHVYVHLALLAMVAEEREVEYAQQYGPKRVTRSRAALERAQYLSEQLETSCWPELGLAGKRFVEWFNSILEVLDSSPPPKGSYVHLLLDRYLREARLVELALQRADDRTPALLQRLKALSNEEVRSCGKALAEVNAYMDLPQFEPDEEPGTQFIRVRRSIAETVREVFPNGYTLPKSKVADEMLTNMIETSSEALKSVLSG
jgi:hypothetical protein